MLTWYLKFYGGKVQSSAIVMGSNMAQNPYNTALSESDYKAEYQITNYTP